jgi:hypothetical protein
LSYLTNYIIATSSLSLRLSLTRYLFLGQQSRILTCTRCWLRTCDQLITEPTRSAISIDSTRRNRATAPSLDYDTCERPTDRSRATDRLLQTQSRRRAPPGGTPAWKRFDSLRVRPDAYSITLDKPAHTRAVTRLSAGASNQEPTRRIYKVKGNTVHAGSYVDDHGVYGGWYSTLREPGRGHKGRLSLTNLHS